MKTKAKPRDIIKRSTGPLGNQTIVVEYDRKYIGTFDTEGEANHAIAAHTKANHSYPTVWIMDDHGNLTVDTEFYPKPGTPPVQLRARAL